MRITNFTFGPFQENTYLLDDGKEAIIVDPGASDRRERQELADQVARLGVRPVRLLLTHAHLDHVLGCADVHDRWGLLPELHRADLPLLEAVPQQAAMFGIPCPEPPAPERFLAEGDAVQLGDARLEVLFVPGHAPGHIALFERGQGVLIAGDTLFHRSIGRTDLPGGDMDTLLRSIREVLYPLGDEVVVHSGHGPRTTIGEERRENPFVRG